MSDIVCWMSKEGNRKEADEKHRRESGGRVWKERVCWMEEMMNIEEWKWREEECGWV